MIQPDEDDDEELHPEEPRDVRVLRMLFQQLLEAGLDHRAANQVMLNVYLDPR